MRRVLDVLKPGAFTYRAGRRRRDPRRRRHRPRGAQRRRRLHRHSAQPPTTSTRPSAVCRAAVLYVFRTLVDDHPDERRLPQAARHRHSRRLDAQSALSGGGRGRQRRDLAVHHRRALWRARRAGRGPGHDEQLHLRQRPLSVLRDHLRRLGRRARFRRHRRGAHPHDQLAPDRPRGAGMALPGAAREPPSAAARAAPGATGAATAPSAGSASSSR